MCRYNDVDTVWWIPTEHWHGVCVGRHGVSDEQRKHCVGDEYADSERDLLARLHRQREHEH